MLYRCIGSEVQILKHGSVTHISLPDTPANPPILCQSRGGRYIFLGNDRSCHHNEVEQPAGAHGLWVYDWSLGRLTAVPHKVKKDDVYWDAVFGPESTLFFSDGNTLWRWTPGQTHTEKLIRFQQAKGAPIGLDLSPDGRYLSYCKFRSDSQILHLYEVNTGAVRDLRFSIFHYGWLDSTHVVWTKSGGLKVLDTEGGKSRTILRDRRALLKRCPQAAELLEVFVREEHVSEEMDFLGVQSGRIWFSLCLSAYHVATSSSVRDGYPRHRGIWSVEPDGSHPKLHFTLPSGCTSLSLQPDESVCWMERDHPHVPAVQVWDGQAGHTISGWCLPTSRSGC